MAANSAPMMATIRKERNAYSTEVMQVIEQGMEQGIAVAAMFD